MKSRASLQIQAYEYLKEQILSGKLDAEVLYSETKMSAEIGVSRTPMREAIQCLSQDGYIHVVPSKGFMIRQLNERDMEESIQVRCAIEGFCTHLIASSLDHKKTKDLLSDLEELLKRQETTLLEEGAEELFMQYDHQFHLSLVQYAENEDFNQMIQKLMYLIRLTTVEALAIPGRIEDTMKEHKLYYHHLIHGDGDAAYQVLMTHLMMPVTMNILKE